MTESELQVAVADYLRLQYPDVLFHSDYGSGVKLTPRQAAIQKRQNGGRRAWPDMFIAGPRAYASTGWRDGSKYNKLRDAFCDQADAIDCGLFIELKKEGTRLVKSHKTVYSDGVGSTVSAQWATEHIAEQAKVLENLRERGYCAEFAVGFDEAKKIIDEYLGGK